ncbi:MAG: phosphoribosylglycinamide formyltransferase [Pantoea sp. Brub]|nr:phosphoribosylglycinamide formyltransferase [Pantoea sp. Brub]
MKKIVILISGMGSNLLAIINACKKGIIDGEIAAVITDKPSAYGLVYAKQENIPIKILNAHDFLIRENFDKQLVEEIDVYQPHLIVLSGYMRILSNFFVMRYYGYLINIHPSLLPKYPGLNTYSRVLKNKDLEHGTSIHFVTEQVDNGPIIIQSKVPVYFNDDKFKLMQRVKTQEHIIYPLVINWFLKERLVMQNRQVWLDGIKLPSQGYTYKNIII